MSDSQQTAPLEEAAPWTAQVQKELRGEDLRMPLTDFVKAYRDTAKERETVKKELGELKARPIITIPKADSKPEEIANYRKAAGVPDTPDGYRFSIPDGVPKDAIKPEDFKSFADLAHKHNISPAAAQEIVAFETARAVAARKAYADEMNAKTKANSDALIAKYGVDGAKVKVADALKVVEALGGKELKDELEQGQGNNPKLIEAFIKLGPLFAEKGISLSGLGQGAAGEIDLHKVYPKSTTPSA
jgi:hypothetical protein